MPLPYYFDYAAHALRYYSENVDKRDRLGTMSKAEVINWNCVMRTLTLFSAIEQKIMLELYRQPGNIVECVKAISEKYAIPNVDVWDLNNRFLTEFSRQRGLI